MVTLAFYLNDREDQLLGELAKAQGLSKTQLIKNVVCKFLDSHAKQRKVVKS